jgi:hypothetical protein
LEQKEGRTPPPIAIIKYGDKNDVTADVQLAATEDHSNFDVIKELINAGIVPSDEIILHIFENEDVLSSAWNKFTYILQQGILPSENSQIIAIEYNPLLFFSLYGRSGRLYGNEKMPYKPSPKVKKAAYDAYIREFGKIPEELKKFFD